MGGGSKRWLATAVAGVLLAGILAGCRSCSVRVREEAAAGEPPESGRELVVLVHGMRRTGRSMGVMAKALREAGYDTAVCDYPSRWGVHETTTNLFAVVGPVAEKAPKVHFVTHSLGSILVRDAFRDGGAPTNLGRVVMMGPPNGGSEHIDRLGRLPLFGTVWGGSGPELGTGADSFPNRLPPMDFDCGVIAGTRGRLLGYGVPKPNDGKVSVASAGAGGPREVVVMPVNHTWMMRDKEVIAATLRYLRDGRFGDATAAGEE